jgi:type II secretory pathway component PulF
MNEIKHLIFNIVVLVIMIIFLIIIITAKRYIIYNNNYNISKLPIINTTLIKYNKI